MEVSETVIKFSSAMQEVGEQLEMGSDVVFQGSGSVVKEEHYDLQDGTKRVSYIIKPTMVVVRKAERVG